MCLHRPFADYEGFGDFGIGMASGDELKNLLFAMCEGGETSQSRLLLPSFAYFPTLQTRPSNCKKDEIAISWP